MIIATVPDIFVTPAVQAMDLSAQTIADDEAIIQETNAAITQFALSKGVAVVDLYAAYQTLLGSSSLTIPNQTGGVTFSSSSFFSADGFNPSPLFQSLLANLVIDAADLGFLAGLTPLSDQQLLANIGQTTTITGPTYFNLSPFVLAPAVPPLTTETVTATLSGTSGHDVVVDLSFGGSAEGTDYFRTAPFIVIPAGQTSASITLTGLGEPSALVVVSIADAAAVSGATVAQTTLPTLTTVLTTTPSIVQLGISPTTFSPTSGRRSSRRRFRRRARLPRSSPSRTPSRVLRPALRGPDQVPGRMGSGSGSGLQFSQIAQFPVPATNSRRYDDGSRQQHLVHGI